METKTAKSAKKSKKVSRKAAARELRENLTSRFLEVVKGLGHNSDSIRKDIRKTSKKISKKLSSTFAEVLDPTTEKKLPKKEKKKMLMERAAVARKGAKPVAKRELIKAEKVVAQAASGKKKVSAVKKTAGFLSASATVTNAGKFGEAGDERSGKDRISPKSVGHVSPEQPAVSHPKARGNAGTGRNDLIGPS